MDWDNVKRREAGRNGEALSPRAPKRPTLAQERAMKKAEAIRHPERAPGPVKRLSREEIERLYGSTAVRTA